MERLHDSPGISGALQKVNRTGGIHEARDENPSLAEIADVAANVTHVNKTL